MKLWLTLILVAGLLGTLAQAKNENDDGVVVEVCIKKL